MCSQLCSGKGIPHTVNGLDLLFQPQFAAQMLDMYIHRAGNADAGVAPGGMQQVAAAYSLAAVVKQHLQQGKLLRGQGNILPVARNGACLQVNIQILVMRCGISAVHSHTITSFGGKF